MIADGLIVDGFIGRWRNAAEYAFRFDPLPNITVFLIYFLIIETFLNQCFKGFETTEPFVP